MVAGTVIIGVIALTMAGSGYYREVGLGLLGPLLAAVGSWELIERTFRREPARVTGLMAVAFGVKMVFFGAYVVVMLKGLALQTIPFTVSFTAAFIGLYAAEAVFLKRLFADGASGAR